jgi:hypothetical protein
MIIGTSRLLNVSYVNIRVDMFLGIKFLENIMMPTDDSFCVSRDGKLIIIQVYSKGS